MGTKMVVVDTHALLWFLTGDKRLGKKAFQQLLAAESGKIKLIIPVVVLIEMMVIVEKKRANIDWKIFLHKIMQFPKHQIYPIDTQVVVAAKEISEKLELHDRLIVATAKMNHAKLITVDPEIHRYGKIEIIW